MNNQKGGLIQKKKKPLMQPPAPVKKIQEMDFGYSEVVNAEVAPTQELVKEITRVEPAQSRKKLGVGKMNSTKSIKVPTVIHSEIFLLGSFMDENKTYTILQTLIDSYVKNELTDRQQRQFDFMVEAFHEEK